MKLVDFLVRADGLTHEEFVRYWEEEHAPLVAEMPNVQRYVQSVPNAPGKSEYDGMLELYFEDMDALRAAFDSEAGQRVVADAAEFTDTDAGPTLYLEESVQFDHR